MDTSASGVTVFCLVRHGETDWNVSGRRQGREDLSLNQTGLQQARLTGAYLSRWQWDAVVSSPLSRALQTAQIIEERIGTSGLEHFDQLVERDYGAASGLTNQEIAARWPDGAIPGLEDMEDLKQRAFSALQSLAGRFADKRVVVVAHGGLINAALAVLSGGEIGSGKTGLANACLSYVSYSESRWRIDEYNSVAHLEGAVS